MHSHRRCLAAGLLIFFLAATADLCAQSEAADSDQNQVTVTQDVGFGELLNSGLEYVNGILELTLFWDASFGLLGVSVPFVVVFLALGAVFFTLWHGLINVRAFKHAIDVVRGKFDNPHDTGEVTHFRALTSALSATVGLGNIAGVAIAVRTGGPGAIFWMMVLAVFGMTAKFHECTLAQMFRHRNPDGTISGGPMFYLHEGLKRVSPKLGIPGKVLAVVFAVMCMGGALGGGNMFQANQSFEAFASAFHIDGDHIAWAANGYGIVMAILVGMVIIGGIKRIGACTCKIVPAMCGLYVIASLVIIVLDIHRVPEMIALVFTSAFAPDAAMGGVIGVMVIGFTRAAFSNEAGLGSAAIAHAAAKTEEPVREGIVALLEPFIDTIVICALTATVVLITGAYKDAPQGANGSAVTMYAFEHLPYIGQWFPFILSVCIILFAFSTMISWCYYGERAWMSLFGPHSLFIFRLVFVVFVYIGSVTTLKEVLAFSDFMILCMAFPNILGGLILAPMVKRKVVDYWGRYQRGEMHPITDKVSET